MDHNVRTQKVMNVLNRTINPQFNTNKCYKLKGKCVYRAFTNTPVTVFLLQSINV